MPDKIYLREFEDKDGVIAVIDANARASAISWGFVVLLSTVVIGIAAYAWIDASGKPVDALREWLQTTIAGEVGLLAGLLGSRQSSNG